MELRRLLQSERFPLFAVASRDVPERSVGRKRLGIERVLCFFHTWRRLWQLPCFRLSAIFGRKNLRSLQILVRIHMLRFFLLILLPGLLLARGVSDILGVTLREAKNSAGDDENSRAGKPDKMGNGPRGARGAGQ
jgi:hypothetical protein